MARVRTNVASKRRKKRVFKQTKGQFGHRKNRFVQAQRSLIKGMVYSYRDRKVKKREFRHLWIIRINAACKEHGILYSRFIKGLNTAKIALDRRQLAELAVTQPQAFTKIVELVKSTNGG